MEALSALCTTAVPRGALSPLAGDLLPLRASLYADDAIIMFHPSRRDATAIQVILKLLGEAAGLVANLSKSSITPLNCTDAQIEDVMEVLGCPIKQLPITYLGLPLSVRKPTKAMVQPMMDKMAKNLAGWKPKLLSPDARLALIKHVLLALPLYFMSVLELPAWAIKEIEKNCRGFLWKGNDEAAGSCSLVAWEKLCMPVENGGLGIRNLRLTGVAMRTRWIWLRRTQPERPWTRFAPASDKRSIHCFKANCKTVLGNGEITSFWTDGWLPDGGSVESMAPSLFSFVKDSGLTVAQALQGNAWVSDIHGGLSILAIAEFLRLWDLVAAITLVPANRDTLVWTASANGDFTLRSTYARLLAGKTACPLGKIVWKSRAPARCKFFMFLAVRGACLTADNLQRRGWHLASFCHLCKHAAESCRHIFQECEYTHRVWEQVHSRLGLNCEAPGVDLATWWHTARKAVAKVDRKTFDAGVILVTWLVWKERNARIFENREASVSQLCATIAEEWSTWTAAGLLAPIDSA